MESNTCATSLERCRGNQNLLSVTENGVTESVMETARCAASWKAIPVKRHGKVVMECIMETARRVASWKGVTQSDTYGASRNSRHGMRNWKHQRSHNVAPSECDGKVVMDSVMESNTCATSWKGVTEINICLASPTQWPTPSLRPSPAYRQQHSVIHTVTHDVTHTPSPT